MLWGKKAKTPDKSRRANVEDRVDSRKYMYHSQRIDKLRDTKRSDTPSVRDDSRLRAWIRNLPTILAFMIIIATIVYISTLNDNPQIIINNPSKINFLHPVSVYQNSIDSILGNSVLNSSKFTIDTNRIESEFETKFPEIDKVTL